MSSTLRLALVLALAAVATAAAVFAVERWTTTPTPRVGILIAAPANAPNNMTSLYQGLRDLGYVEGQNIVIDRRYADGREDRLRELAAELAREKVDVIVALGPSSTRAAREATSTIPVVFASLDAVEQGIVPSLARPGGNLTGWSVRSSESGGKQLALLKEAIPDISRVAVVANPAMPGHAALMRSLESDATALGLRLFPIDVPRADALPAAFDEMKKAGAEAFFLIAEPTVIDALRVRIVALAAEHRLPAMYPWRMYADAGGLMSYGPSLPDLIRRHAYFVHRILTGTKPADLPVETPDKYELVLNLKTAQALGIAFPASLRQFATDKVE